MKFYKFLIFYLDFCALSLGDLGDSSVPCAE